MDYNNKYKDRKPIDTIKIIYNFFIQRGFEVKIDFVKQSMESGTWSSTIKLFRGNKEILSSNGKGVTKLFCLASGFGELYERFCNKIFIFNNPFAMDLYLKSNYSTNGFYFDKNEKILNNEEIFMPKKIQQHMKDLGGNYYYLVKQFYELTCNNNFIGVPFYNILNKDILYIDPRIASNVVGSSGMCAGNSFYEAFNQGFSEIIEHHLEGIFRHKQFEEYPVIDVDKITNSTIQNILSKIKEYGNEVYILDFSYILDLPIIMTFLINKKTHMITKNIAAFPVFEIALERSLTELYQGSLDTLIDLKPEGFIPYLSSSADYWENCWSGTPSLEETFPEFILKNLKYEAVPNKNIFLFERDKQYSNKEIFNYYKDLCINNNLEVYCWNNSLIDDVTSLYIYVDNLTGLNYRLSSIHRVKNKKKVLEFCINLFKVIKNNLNDNSDIDLFKKIMKDFISFDFFEKKCIFNCLLFNNWLDHYEASFYVILNFFSYILYGNYDIFTNKILFNDIKPNVFYSENLKKYLILERYIEEKYCLEDIIYFTKLLGLNTSYNDIKNFNNKDFIINEYFSNFKNYFTSNDYIKYIESLL